jgi:hypothetical protein
MTSCTDTVELSIKKDSLDIKVHAEEGCSGYSTIVLTHQTSLNNWKCQRKEGVKADKLYSREASASHPQGGGRGAGKLQQHGMRVAMR